MMSVSESAAAATDAAIEAAHALAPEVRQYLAEENPMLTGPCTVTLTITFTNPVTPELAADMAAMEIARNGTNAYIFQIVDDNTGDVHYVRAGQHYSQEELEAELEDLREENEERAGGSS